MRNDKQHWRDMNHDFYLCFILRLIYQKMKREHVLLIFRWCWMHPLIADFENFNKHPLWIARPLHSFVLYYIDFKLIVHSIKCHNLKADIVTFTDFVLPCCPLLNLAIIRHPKKRTHINARSNPKHKSIPLHDPTPKHIPREVFCITDTFLTTLHWCRQRLFKL